MQLGTTTDQDPFSGCHTSVGQWGIGSGWGTGVLPGWRMFKVRSCLTLLICCKSKKIKLLLLFPRKVRKYFHSNYISRCQWSCIWKLVDTNVTWFDALDMVLHLHNYTAALWSSISFTPFPLAHAWMGAGPQRVATISPSTIQRICARCLPTVSLSLPTLAQNAPLAALTARTYTATILVIEFIMTLSLFVIKHEKILLFLQAVVAALTT